MILAEVLNAIYAFNIILIVVESVYCLRLPRRKHFKVVFPICAAAFAIFANPYVPFFKELYIVLFPYFGLAYLIYYAASCFIIYASFEIKLSQAFFVGAVAYAFEHMLNQVKYLWMGGVDAAIGLISSRILLFLMIAALTALFCYFVLRPNKSMLFGSNIINIIYSVVTLSIVLGASWIILRQNMMNSAVMTYIIMLCVMLLSMMLVSGGLMRAEKNKEILKQLLEQSEKQSVLAQENVDIINRKCHDLKYQISALKTMENAKQREKSIAELERAVMIYDSLPKSGGGALWI